MPTLRQVLDLLSRDELLALVDAHGVIVGSRRAKAHLADRLEEKGLAPDLLLGGLSRDRLGELCRALGLDDGGRAKAPLIERLSGGPSTSTPAPQLALPLGEVAPPSRAPASRRPSVPPASAPRGERPTQDALESHLWEAANILRGSPVDRTDWKSFILLFLSGWHETSRVSGASCLSNLWSTFVGVPASAAGTSVISARTYSLPWQGPPLL
jgi:type I restriction enzyme M protein